MEQGRSQSLRLNQGQKLIPRDISESLGKMPPGAEQSQDLEPAVLGALMLESKAWDHVSGLRPQHFYDDRHKEIMNACLELRSLNEPVDMRTVIAQLRKTGKIEIVGGTYYIAEVTSKVHSSANVGPWARILIEESMKRVLIETASQAHHDAYEPGTDIFELLDRQIERLQFLKDRETKSDGPERIRVLWEKVEVKTKPERPETLIKIGETDVCTVGNISLLVGAKKSRKSLLAAQLIGWFLQGRTHLADEVVIFDTEQEEYDVWLVRERIYKMTNQWVSCFALRGLSPKDRREFISQTVKHWKRPIKIALIDGIRDCMSNINDPEESTEVMTWLMQMNVETKIHFINVLHLNKTDDNARGHIGTELLNKAEITIKTVIDKKTGYTVVECESSRRKPFDHFVLTHSRTGMPEIMGGPATGEQKENQEELKKLEGVFEGEILKYGEMIEAIKTHFQFGQVKAKQRAQAWINRGWILKSGNSRSTNTTYKLVSAPARSVPKNEESTLFNQYDQPIPVIPVREEPPPPTSDDLPF